MAPFPSLAAGNFELLVTEHSTVGDLVNAFKKERAIPSSIDVRLCWFGRPQDPSIDISGALGGRGVAGYTFELQ